MSYTFNPFTGQLDATYIPVLILGNNSLLSNFTLASTQQMLAIFQFTIGADLTLNGDFLVL